MSRRADLERLAAAADGAWRDPAQVAGLWSGASRPDPALLAYSVRGEWWDLLAEQEITLLITREYEHFALALSTADGHPEISYLALPHPSGLAVDLHRNRLYLAATRNPNLVVELSPVTRASKRLDMDSPGLGHRHLVPVTSTFLPGCLYLHDLAMIAGRLHGNAVGHNAVVSLAPGGGYERVWWPRSIEREGGPVFGRNYLQLNSIAAGDDLESSFFSASTDKIARCRPGDPDFPVDRRGVVFSGRTRDVVARGLTRPHSARLHRGQLWIDNSGYGEIGRIDAGAFEPLTRLPGWTRGLCFHQRVAFVGTSRILPRFEQYAPGLEADRCVCGVHAIDMESGRILGALEWPAGNQIFAVEAIPVSFSRGFPFSSTRDHAASIPLFYSYEIDVHR